MFEIAYEFDILPSVWRYYHTPAFKRAIKTFDEVTDIIYGYVNKAVEKHEKNPSSGNGGVLEKLLKVDKNIAIIMAIDMLSAGIDTVRYFIKL